MEFPTHMKHIVPFVFFLCPLLPSQEPMGGKEPLNAAARTQLEKVEKVEKLLKITRNLIEAKGGAEGSDLIVARAMDRIASVAKAGADDLRTIDPAPTTPTPTTYSPPAALPDGEIATYMRTAKISGPACHEGGVCTGTLRIKRFDNGRKLRLEGHLDVQNHCLTDNIHGRVFFKLLKNGVEVSSFAVETGEQNPGRGLPWNSPTGRGGSGAVELVRQLEFDRVEMQFLNKNHGGPALIDPIQLALQIIPVGR